MSKKTKEPTIEKMFPDFTMDEAHVIDDIEVGERLRSDMGDLDELAKSLDKNSIMHPLVVFKNKGSGKRYILAAGGRRHGAMVRIAKKTKKYLVPVRVMPDYGEKEMGFRLRTIELAENVDRKDLTPMERCLMKERIHKEYVRFKGTKIAGSKHGHGVIDTAKIFGESAATTSGDLKLAEIYKKLPKDAQYVFDSAKTREDITKIVKTANKAANRVKQTAEAKRRMGDSPNKKQKLAQSFQVLPAKSKDILKNGFFEGVQRIEDGTIDLAEIDPPYGIDLKVIKKNPGSSLHEYNEVGKDIYPEFLEKVLYETSRVLRKDSWIIFWYANEWFDTIKAKVKKLNKTQRAGLRIMGIPGIWGKTGFAGQSQSPNYVLANQYESFLLIKKGSPELNKPGTGNLFLFDPVPSLKKRHPTERPFALIEKLISALIPEGKTVMVPFAGSGKTLQVANKLNCDCIGWDLSKEYKDTFLISVANDEEI